MNHKNRLLQNTTAKILLATTLIATSAMTQAAPPSISGKWQSVGVENYGQVYATRQFQMTAKDWGVVYRAYHDAEGKQPLFTIRVKGVYALGDLSSTVSNAYEGIFPALSRRLTAESDAGVQLFSSMGCQLIKGKEVALVNQGCGFIPGLMQVMGEYDLVSIRNGQLFLGDRAGDLSKQRPTALTTYPLKRVR